MYTVPTGSCCSSTCGWAGVVLCESSCWARPCCASGSGVSSSSSSSSTPPPRYPPPLGPALQKWRQNHQLAATHSRHAHRGEFEEVVLRVPLLLRVVRCQLPIDAKVCFLRHTCTIVIPLDRHDSDSSNTGIPLTRKMSIYCFVLAHHHNQPIDAAKICFLRHSAGHEVSIATLPPACTRLPSLSVQPFSSTGGSGSGGRTAREGGEWSATSARSFSTTAATDLDGGMVEEDVDYARRPAGKLRYAVGRGKREGRSQQRGGGKGRRKTEEERGQEERIRELVEGVWESA